MTANKPNYPRPRRGGSGFKDNSNLDKLFKTMGKGENVMNKEIEFKIMFKNGHVARYRFLDSATASTEKEMIIAAEELLKMFEDSKVNDKTGVVGLVECGSDKKTLIDISEIVTIGYKLVGY